MMHPSNFFTLEGNSRKDGMIRFTCDELPGFRLLLKEEADASIYEEEVQKALKAFLPLHFRAQAQNFKVGIGCGERMNDGAGKQGYKMVASITAG